MTYCSSSIQNFTKKNQHSDKKSLSKAIQLTAYIVVHQLQPVFDNYLRSIPNEIIELIKKRQ